MGFRMIAAAADTATIVGALAAALGAVMVALIGSRRSAARSEVAIGNTGDRTEQALANLAVTVAQQGTTLMAGQDRIERRLDRVEGTVVAIDSRLGLVETRLAVVEDRTAELKPNHGHSIKDQLVRIDQALASQPPTRRPRPPEENT